MPIIKNIGKQQRMVVDRFLTPGDSRYISPKRVDSFKGDPDFEIVDETPEAKAEVRIQKDEVVTLLKVQIVDDEPLQTKPEVESPLIVDPAELKLEPIRYPKKRKSEPVRENPAPTATTKRKKSRGRTL